MSKELETIAVQIAAIRGALNIAVADTGASGLVHTWGMSALKHLDALAASQQPPAGQVTVDQIMDEIGHAVHSQYHDEVHSRLTALLDKTASPR